MNGARYAAAAATTYINVYGGYGSVLYSNIVAVAFVLVCAWHKISAYAYSDAFSNG